jgi:hypothetical protein
MPGVQVPHGPPQSKRGVGTTTIPRHTQVAQSSFSGAFGLWTPLRSGRADAHESTGSRPSSLEQDHRCCSQWSVDGTADAPRNLDIDNFHDDVGPQQNVRNEVRNQNTLAYVGTLVVTTRDRRPTPLEIFGEPVAEGRNIERQKSVTEGRPFPGCSVGGCSSRLAKNNSGRYSTCFPPAA